MNMPGVAAPPRAPMVTAAAVFLSCYLTFRPIESITFTASDALFLLGIIMATTGNTKAAADSGAFLAYLDTRPDAVASRLGAVGFRMGGGMAIAATGTCAGRFAAVASFHGGNLATDTPDSPHRYAPRLEAEVYIAAADEGRSYPPEMARRVEAAFDRENVTYRAEVYTGAAHGWMMPDFPVYDEAAAERGWREMLAFFDDTLG